MTNNSNNVTTDIRGAANLTVDAIVGITNMVEALHNTIAGGSAEADAKGPVRTKGIPGLVYRNIRGITGMVGGGIDILLAQLGTAVGELDSPPGREATLAALNGVFGDYLVARSNPLAIPMRLNYDGQPLDDQVSAEIIQQVNGRIVVMVHGSCMNGSQWKRQGHDHGAALARDLGIAPLYVHYNSGLHTSENGRELAILMETMSARAQRPLEITLIGYSMGGLVARSACYYGKIFGHNWLNHLENLLFLGTPHHGAYLEKGGNWIDLIMGISPYSAPFSRLGKVRSAGLTDMRYGNVIDDDWQGRDRFGNSGDQRVPVPLPAGVNCYALAATRGDESSKLADDLVGDGLVTVSSALGYHKNEGLNLSIPVEQQWVGRKMNHLDLLNHPSVYEIIKNWVEGQ